MIEWDCQVLWLRNWLKSSNKSLKSSNKKNFSIMLSTYTAPLKSWSVEKNIQEVLQDRWVLRISQHMETPNILLALKRTCKDTQKFLLMFWSVRNTRSSTNIFTSILEIPLSWFFFQKDGCCSTSVWNSIWNIQHSVCNLVERICEWPNYSNDMPWLHFRNV